MLSAFANCFKIPELRHRIFFTLLIIAIVRVGAAIQVPGVSPEVLGHYFKDYIDNTSNSTVVGMFNLFSGGALENCAIFSLGIIPYISASIMLQLLTAVVPRLSKLAREEGGRQKITQYTRYATIAICLVQGYFIAKQFENPGTANLLPNIEKTILSYGPLVPDAGPTFEFTTVLCLSTGTLLLMWLGEQITDKGIGNGISMIITVNIVSRLPSALLQGWEMLHPPAGSTSPPVSPIVLVPLLLFLFGVIAGTIAIIQAVRRVTVQYAQQIRGNKVMSGNSYLPLKVNYAGVMPIIFAQSILQVPSFMIGVLPLGALPWIRNLLDSLQNGWPHYVLYIAMIFFFSYFWVATTFNPIQISEELKNNRGFIPGIRPGTPTADFLEYSMTRLTLAGALFLTILAVLPQVASHYFRVPNTTASFFGGTSLLIVIGVMLDTMKQMETHLLQRHYDGFLKKGKIRRSVGPAAAAGPTLSSSGIVWLYVLISALLIIGAVLLLHRT